MNYYQHHIGDFEETVPIHKLPMVYIVSTPNFQFIKIGKSTSFKQRLGNIQSGCPFDLSLWLSIRTPKPSEIECCLHERLSHCLVRGEWFSPTDSDLDSVMEFCANTNKNVKEMRHALLQA